MDKTLVICEKPTAAVKIASALAEKRPKRGEFNGAPYYEFERGGKQMVVVPALGHLFTLKNLKPMRDYPIYDIGWVPSYEASKKAKRTQVFVEAIRELAKDATDWISACDYDIEGSLIGYNVLRYLCGEEAVKRAKQMKFSTLTASDLQQAYENLIPCLDFELIDAGIARHVLDWYWGMNVSKAMSAAVETAQHRFAKLSAGRVQTPTLKILAEKEKEIKAFKPEPFWILSLLLELDGKEILAEHATPKFFDRVEAERARDACQDKPACITEIQTRQYRRPPPVPFDLGLLQSEAYRCFGYTPMRTQQIAQGLYQAGLCVTGDTLVMLPSGEIMEMKQFVGEKNNSLMGVNELDLKATKCECTHWLKLPSPPRLVKLTLEGGHSITLTEDHPVMALENGRITWVAAKRLNSSDYVAVADHVRVSRQQKPSTVFTIMDGLPHDEQRKVMVHLRVEFIRLLAKRLAGKGILYKTIAERFGISRQAVYHYFWKRKHRLPYSLLKWLLEIGVCNEGELEKNIQAYSWSRGNKKFEIPFWLTEGLMYFVGLMAADGHNSTRGYLRIAPANKFKTVLPLFEEIFGWWRKDSANGYVLNAKLVSKLLTVLGVPTGRKCETIDIPNVILKQPDDLLWAYIAGFFDGDGSVKLKPTLKSESVRVSFTSRGRLFLRKLKLALLTYGIDSYLYQSKDARKLAEDLLIYSDDFAKMTHRIYSYLRVKKQEWKTALQRYKQAKPFSHSHRLIPLGKLGTILSSEGISVKKLSNLVAHDLSNAAKGRRIQKRILALMAEHVNNKSIKMLGKGNVIWKRVKEMGSINSGQSFVFDVTTTNNTFIGNGVVLHNCSYPRTSSQKLPPTINYARIIEQLGGISKQYKRFADELLTAPELKPNEGKKVDPAHPAVYPTGEKPGTLTGPQHRLYDLIVRRFFSVFGKHALAEGVRVELDVGGQPFLLRGRRVLEEEWLACYPFAKTEEVILPRLEKGQTLTVKELRFEQRETQPPPRYNPASIVKEMESRNLGTKATRASILQNIYGRSYIFGNQITVTDLGLEVVDSLDKHCPEIASEELTAQFEREMEAIQEGKRNKEEVILRAREELDKILKKFRAHQLEIGEQLGEAYRVTRQKQRILGTCLKCGGQLKVVVSRATHKRFAGCSNYPTCRNSFPLPQAGIIISLGKTCEQCGAPMIQVNRIGMRPYRMCLDPKCPSKKDWGKRGGQDHKKYRKIKLTL